MTARIPRDAYDSDDEFRKACREVLPSDGKLHCDFCADDEKEIVATWLLTSNIRMEVVDPTGATPPIPIDYSRDWAACASCDEAVASHDADGMAEYVAKLPSVMGHVEGEPNLENGKMLYREFYARDPIRIKPLRKRPPLQVLAENDGPGGGRWKEAYMAQTDLWRVQTHPVGRAALQRWTELEAAPGTIKRAMYEKLVDAEADKLMHLPPVYVSEDMVDLIEHARKTFKPEVVVHEDLLLPAAFLYFARPILLHDKKGSDVNVQAISYAPLYARTADDDQVREGISLAFYSSVDEPADADYEELKWDAEGIRSLGLPFNHVLLHITPLLFGVDPAGEEVDADFPDGPPTGAKEWWSLLQVTLRMMLERVSDPHARVPDRHMRKRAAKLGMNPGNVIVVRLRRVKHDRPTESERDVHWTHRWISVGHWRMQPYPTLGITRQRWVQGSVKGPKDKPLIVKQKVYEWRR